MLNKKPLILFLVLTFGITLALILVSKFMGYTLVGTPPLFSQLFIFFAMFVPGISALIVQKFVVKKPLKDLGFKWGSWKMYAKTYLLILLIAILTYALTWAFVVPPDFTLVSFMNQYAAQIPDMTLPLPAWQMILLLSFVTFITAPILNLIPALGEEVGWRGFLLPALEPLGKFKASLYTGLIWALWHTPMILILGFAYGEQAWPGVLLHFTLVVSLGLWFGHVWFQTRSTILAGFMHATFNAHAYGIWVILFVSPNKLLIGAAGLISVLLWLGVGVKMGLKLKSEMPKS